ncbi:RICIN domain-containing protein [Actinophytocola sp.]|uniref:RICIN domain-containing protein n=1 Tax=Actinophytocola sp. TaxID=1872138 RepID=UPI00389A51A2
MKNRRVLTAVVTFISLTASGVVLADSAHAAEATTSATAQAALAGDFIQIVNDRTDKCVDVLNASTATGAVLQEFDCKGNAAQAFRPVDVGNGFFQLANGGSALCMEAAVGDRVRQQFCNPAATGQWWRWGVANNVGALVLASGIPGLCLALVPNTIKNGAAIATIDCSGTNSADLWHAE